MALTVITAGSAAVSSVLNNNFDYLDGRITSTNSTVATQASSISSLNTTVQGLQTPGVTTLTGTTPTLTDNTQHTITISGNTTFTLPGVSDATKFHQILVLMYMPTLYSLTLGTTTYFGGIEPDLSDTGRYTLIYEYDGTQWVVGALYKAEEEE